MGEWPEPERWSSWLPFADGVAQAPLEPGVYVVRTALGESVVYVGMARERRGRGLRGRLAVYATGKAAVSGLGEAAFNRALADIDWVRDRLRELEAGEPRSAKQWARAAVDRWDLQVCWATTADGREARDLERRVMAALDEPGLWNVRRS